MCLLLLPLIIIRLIILSLWGSVTYGQKKKTKKKKSWCFSSKLMRKVSKVLAVVASGGSLFHSLMVLERNKNCLYRVWQQS